MTPTQNQQTPTPNRDQNNTPVKEFPELDPSEPQKPEQNPPPMMGQEKSRKGGTSNTNVNNQPDRENTSRSGNQQGRQSGSHQQKQ